MVAALPKAYLALINAKCCSKGARGQASQDTSGAELVPGDQVIAQVCYSSLRSVSPSVPSLAAA